jgi:type II secretory pathway component PulL
MTKTQKKELAWALQTKISRNVEQQLYCEGEALRLGIELVRVRRTKVCDAREQKKRCEARRAMKGLK